MKDNQPELRAAIADAFADHPHTPSSERERRLRRAEQQTTTTIDKGHGRIERRTLTRTTALNGYLDWPGVAQVFVLRRQRTIKGRTATDTAYGLTSLTPEQADADDLMQLVRGHWGIENRLFHVRDATLGEDACRVRRGHGAHNLAIVRNLAVTLLNLHGIANKAAALRRHAAHPQEALALIHSSPEN